ncbi:Ribonuclease BN [Nitrococcus mobilis Nb-231]|uniref:Ribonuclease BN n=2 Tax=Nitrococcus mobilis TaxID=35797 RepID=A4BTE4_9GAMM|nr:YihY/virulence factor BrkB family protein [Nitrococcus mobilis]EAR21046.1 Ribonuclease BN [Nitrococcus mobilis Nb-231]
MARTAATERARGRQAERLREIPKAGWRDILLRTKSEISNDHLSMAAAGVAFYAMLALFPALAAIISIWGLVSDPQQVMQQIQSVSGMLPDQTAAIIKSQATKVASASGGAVSLAALGSVLLAVYSASKGMKALIEGLNMVYDEEEKRGFIKLNLVALILTIGLVLVMIAALGMIAAIPALLGSLGLGAVTKTAVIWLRWPLLFVVAIASLALIYRYAPSRTQPRWRWVSVGAVVATLLWIAGSFAFSFYTRNFGSYNETYGSLGAVIILLTWLWLSAFVVLLGAELNSEEEHQTARDTTRGRPQPMGKRGAHAADTIGEKPG